MRPVRIANCSGFYGDRLAAPREMLDGPLPVDVLTGDYLAELTMLILWKAQQRDPDAGYARTFLTQMEDVLGTCLDRGVKIVTNAGGLNPRALADRLRELGERLGATPQIAVVEGDDILDRIPELQRRGVGVRASRPRRLARGCRGEAGDRQRVSRRVGDRGRARREAPMWWCAAASPTPPSPSGRPRGGTVGLATTGMRSRVRWSPATCIECGPQATGGNYPFLDELAPGLPGFPIAEVAADGSSVITKQPGTGGAVTIGTVTAQLLYEIDAPRYANPDVVARFDTIALEEIDHDRVQTQRRATANRHRARSRSRSTTPAVIATP